jgi:hypothetical protein
MMGDNMRKNLLCVLLGVLLATGAFAVRAAIAEYQQLETRVSYIEGYLGMLDQMLRSGR